MKIINGLLIVVLVALASVVAAQNVYQPSVPVVTAQEGEKSVNGEVVERYYVIRIGNTLLGEMRENSIIQASIFSLWSRDAAIYTKNGDLWKVEIFNKPANKEEAELFLSNPPDSWYNHRFYSKATTKKLPAPLDGIVLPKDISLINYIVMYKEGGIKVFLSKEVSSLEAADTLAEKIRECLSTRRTM